MKVIALAGALLAAALPSAAKSAEGRTLDAALPPGENYARAEFRLWLPFGAGQLRGALILVPGSNADGRPMVDDVQWRNFAARQRLALVGCFFADHPHPQDFIEAYADAVQGSGQALLNAMSKFAAEAGHPELADAPLLLWGESAGGEFNYEFAAWKPDRVIAFVVNKGGIYYSALVAPATRAVPALFFAGGADLESRTATIRGLFALNRRAGARWGLVEEPGVGHEFERSRALGLLFFEEVLPLRLDGSGPALRPLPEASGFWGDLKTKTYRPAGAEGASEPSNAWLPTERVARAWQATVSGHPPE